MEKKSNKPNSPNYGKQLFSELKYCIRCCLPDTNENIDFDRAKYEKQLAFFSNVFNHKTLDTESMSGVFCLRRSFFLIEKYRFGRFRSVFGGIVCRA